MFKALIECIFDPLMDVFALVNGACTIGDGGDGIVVREGDVRKRHGNG